MPSSRWLCHRSRHCLPVRPGRKFAMVVHARLRPLPPVRAQVEGPLHWGVVRRDRAAAPPVSQSASRRRGQTIGRFSRPRA
eukprot:4610137-Prymnesium_polylepis.1